MSILDKRTLKAVRPLQIKTGDEVYIYANPHRWFSGTRYRGVVIFPRGWAKATPDYNMDGYAELQRQLDGPLRHPLNRRQLPVPQKGASGVALAVWYQDEWLPVVVSRGLIEGHVRDIRPQLLEARKAQQSFEGRYKQAEDELQRRGLAEATYGLDLTFPGLEHLLAALRAAEAASKELQQLCNDFEGAWSPWVISQKVRELTADLLQALEAQKPAPGKTQEEREAQERNEEAS